MNAALNSPIYVAEDVTSESDSDSNSETPELYLPISADDDQDSEEDSENGGLDLRSQQPINGYCLNQAENGVSSLDLSEGADLRSEEEEEEEEEERMREASDRAIRRAFRDDESRRNARLSPENAMRVVEAMRGISFGGVAPDWVARVPEGSWIDQLQRSRPQPRRPN